MDLPNQKDPKDATQIDYQYDALQHLVGNLVILESVKTTHRQFVNEATMIPMSAHLPQDQTQHRLDYLVVVMFGKD